MTPVAAMTEKEGRRRDYAVKIEGLAAFLAEHGSCRVNIGEMDRRSADRERIDLAAAATSIGRTIRIENVSNMYLQAELQ